MFLPRTASTVLIRLVDLIQRRDLWSAYRAFEESQWWDASRVREYQAEKLRTRIRDLAGRSALIRERLGEAGIDPRSVQSIEDLGRLPVLQKEDLRERGDELTARGLPPGEVTPRSSGGSTGYQVSFFIDRECYRQRDAAALRMWNFLGLGPGARMISIWGQPWDLKMAKRWKERLRRGVDNRRMFSSYRIGQADLDAIVDWMGRNRPDALMGFPSVLDQIARRAIQRGNPDGPRFIISCAETLFPDQRRRMEEAWGAPVFNQYGSREFGVVAMECAEHKGLHVWNERVVVERLDGDSEGPGELLLTDLDNRATPFIRYRIGDEAFAGEEGPCPCGRGLSRLGEVSGRSYDIIRSRSGRAIGGVFFSSLLRTAVQGVETFQVIQHALDDIEILVVPPGGLTDAGKQRTVAEIRNALDDSVQVRFTELAHLPSLQSGKHRFVIAQPSAESAPGDASGDVAGDARGRRGPGEEPL